MKQSTKITLILLTFISMLLLSTACRKTNTEKPYGLNQFVSELKSRDYKMELKNVSKDFLPTTRKRIAVGDEAIDVYIFKSSKTMEDEAKNIGPGGSSYTSSKRFFKKSYQINVSWAGMPHFYKKGTIIVQYIGDNEKIISDLKEIFGGSFAGR